MSKSGLLRSRDYRAALQLLGECQEVGYDQQTWLQHLSNALPPLLGCQLAISYEMLNATRQPLVYSDVGWARPADRNLFLDFLASDKLNDSVFKRFMDAAFAQDVCARQQVLSDRQWYRSDVYGDYMRPTRLDAFVLANRRLITGDTFLCVIVQRPHGARPFPRRAENLVQICTQQLAAAGGRGLTTARDPGVSGLAPRLRQVLRCLLEGDTERQAALRLGVGHGTVHQYVKALYRHFRVNSRAELLAYFLKRAGLRLDVLG